VQSSMTASIDAIKLSMNSGSLNAVHPAVIGIKYLNDGSTSADILPQSQGVKSEKSNAITTAFATIGSILFVIIVFLSVMYLSKKKRRLKSMSTNKRDNFYDTFAFNPAYNDTDLSLSASSVSTTTYKLRDPIVASSPSLFMFESKDGSMDIGLISLSNPSNNVSRNNKRSASQLHSKTPHCSPSSFDFSPILNSKADKGRTDDYDLSSEAVVIKVDRRISKYDNIWF
jgi:hypothetical protein